MYILCNYMCMIISKNNHPFRPERTCIFMFRTKPYKYKIKVFPTSGLKHGPIHYVMSTLIYYLAIYYILIII